MTESQTNVNTDVIINQISIGDRMKTHEMTYDIKISDNHYLCVRLDGHGFSKFTKKLCKPYDKNFSKAMVLSAYDVMCEFNARSAYTQSDEITLIFDIPDLSKNQNYIFNARIQKILSLTASFVSVRFNKYL
jgi:tRNA(His) guanylyltransferase